MLLERVRGTPNRLQGLFVQQPLEKLFLHVPGKWSAMEHVAHLLHLQDLFEERVEDFMARRPRLCGIDLSWQQELLVKHLLRNAGDVLEEFRLKRMAFAARMEQAPVGVLAHVAEHPCKGRLMRPVDMLHWVAEHDDHHLASIRMLLGEVPEPRRGSAW